MKRFFLRIDGKIKQRIIGMRRDQYLRWGDYLSELICGGVVSTIFMFVAGIDLLVKENRLWSSVIFAAIPILLAVVFLLLYYASFFTLWLNGATGRDELKNGQSKADHFSVSKI